MLEQLEKINNIYDLLALCSSYILSTIEEISYEFATFEDGDYDDIYDAIARYCCEKQEKGCIEAFGELRTFMFDFMEPDVTIEKCFAVVKYIDDLVEVEISDKLLGGRGIIKYSSMNTQYLDRVKIIPKMRNTLYVRGELQFKEIHDSSHSLLRKRRDCACSKLDRETVNYMIWDKKLIENYPMWLYHVDEKHPISKHFYDREKIVFGIVPFTNKFLKQILDIKYQKRAFYISGMHEDAEKELKMRYKDICDRCRVEDVDFLIFPEMLMTNNIMGVLQNKEKSHSPQIIINGSIWKDYMNKSILTDGNGKEIFSYCKKEPFTYEEKNIEYREYLDSSKNREYSVLEIEGIGRIGIGICKDLLSEEVKLFHKCIGTNILVIPAYTESMDLQSSAEGLSVEYNCMVVVANACSAFGEKNSENSNRRIGFVSVPAKNKTDRTSVTKQYYKNNCTNECDCKCVGKVISVDFYNTEQCNNIISYVLDETFF